MYEDEFEINLRGIDRRNEATSPQAAQFIISHIIEQLRHSNDLASILQIALQGLTITCQAHRGLVWQIVGDQLAITNEFAVAGRKCFEGKQLGSDESMSVKLEFLFRFPDESGIGVVSVPDTEQDPNLEGSPTLRSLLESGNVQARLMVQLRSRGIISGFIELQQCEPRVWTELDETKLQMVGNLLSVVVQQSLDQSKLETDAKEMKLINEVASIFRESYGLRTQQSLVKSIHLIAEFMGFVHAQAYLVRKELLVPQVDDAKTESVGLTEKDNLYVAVYESGRGKIVNADYTKDPDRISRIERLVFGSVQNGSIEDRLARLEADQFFGHDMALVLPLVSKGERLGVIGLWQRMPNKPQFRPQDRELGLRFASHLSDVFRVDLNVRKLRSDTHDA